jgi:hypothetical protein
MINTNITALALSAAQTCVLANGRVYCWGMFHAGTLNDSPVPAQIDLGLGEQDYIKITVSCDLVKIHFELSRFYSCCTLVWAPLHMRYCAQCPKSHPLLGTISDWRVSDKTYSYSFWDR